MSGPGILFSALLAVGAGFGATALINHASEVKERQEHLEQAIFDSCHIPAAPDISCSFSQPSIENKSERLSFKDLATVIVKLHDKGFVGRAERVEASSGGCLVSAGYNFCVTSAPAGAPSLAEGGAKIDSWVRM